MSLAATVVQSCSFQMIVTDSLVGFRDDSDVPGYGLQRLLLAVVTQEWHPTLSAVPLWLCLFSGLRTAVSGARENANVGTKTSGRIFSWRRECESLYRRLTWSRRQSISHAHCQLILEQKYESSKSRNPEKDPASLNRADRHPRKLLTTAVEMQADAKAAAVQEWRGPSRASSDVAFFPFAVVRTKRFVVK